MGDLGALTDKLVRTYLGYTGGPLVIMADAATTDIALEIKESAMFVSADAKPEVHIIYMESWRQGAPVTSFTESHQDQLGSLLTGTDMYHNTVLWLHQSLPEETPFSKALVGFAEKRGKMGGLPGCTRDVLTAGYHPDNKPEFTKQLYDTLHEERELTVYCDRGTKLTVQFNHELFNLVNSNGILVPGTYGNPLPAEVFAHPVTADGTMVISGSYGHLASHPRFIGKHTLLRDTLNRTPIVWQIKNGRIADVTDVTCDDAEIEQLVRRHVFEVDPAYGNVLGEWGMPANLYILERPTTGNLLVDEKGRPHGAHGDGYQKRTGCLYTSKVHSDGLVENAKIVAGSGKILMDKGKYNPFMFSTLR